MKQSSKSPETGQKRTRRRAMSPEAREKQLIALATDLAEQQLLDGTASAQVISHFLKLGSMREQVELEKTRSEIALLKSRKESLDREERIEELFSNALESFRLYSGQQNEGEEDG